MVAGVPHMIARRHVAILAAAIALLPAVGARAAHPPGDTGNGRAVARTWPHGRMPDLNLSRQDRDDLIAYLLSMREGRAAPATEPKPQRP